MPDDLDVRIRELVARAVADTPAAPELDRSAELLGAPTSDRRRWLIGGSAGLLAAAALTAAFVLVGSGDDAVRTPSTVPQTQPEPSTAPTSTTPSTTSTMTPTPAAPAGGQLLAVAGPDGVTIHDLNGDAIGGRDEPTSIALPVGDGRVVVALASTATSDVFTTVPYIWGPDGSLEEVWPGRDFAGPVTVHDLALIDGRPVLLYSEETAEHAATSEPRHDLYVSYIDGDMTIARVGETIGRQFGRMHLAGTGLIVGESRDATTHRPFFATIPGSAAAAFVGPMGASALGLESEYDNCDDCPRALTVDPVGFSFAWLDGDELVQREIGPNLDPSGVGPERRTALGDVVDTTGVHDLDVFPEGVLVSYSPADGAVRPTVLVSVADHTVTTLGGTLATQGPGLDDGTRPAPPATTTTTTAEQPTAPADAFPISGALVTAGDGGVHRYTDGAVEQLTAEPMDMALDAGDGRVLTQRHRGLSVDGTWSDADTAPLVIGEDGSMEPLFGTVDWDGTVVLHDIDVVDGRRLLLFSLQRPLVPQEDNEDLYVVDLDSAERTLVAEGIGGWEFGTGRLSLATSGLIVGQGNYSPSWGPLLFVVPGSPAAAGRIPTPADLHLEENYPDCADCPTTFTVTPNGLTVAWVSGTEPLVVGSSLVLFLEGGTAPEAEPILGIPDSDFYTGLDFGASGIVVSFFDQPPVFVPSDGSPPVELGDVSTATLSPTG